MARCDVRLNDRIYFLTEGHFIYYLERVICIKHRIKYILYTTLYGRQFLEICFSHIIEFIKICKRENFFKRECSYAPYSKVQHLCFLYRTTQRILIRAMH